MLIKKENSPFTGLINALMLSVPALISLILFGLWVYGYIARFF